MTCPCTDSRFFSLLRIKSYGVLNQLKGNRKYASYLHVSMP